MRILLPTAAFPGPTDPARAPALAALARALAARGHEVTVLAPRVHAADPEREDAPGPVAVRRFEIGSPGRILKSWDGSPPPVTLARYAAGALLSIAGAARAADVVYAHWAVPTGFLATLASAPLGRPLVLHLHGSDVNRYARVSRLYGSLAALAIRRARAVIAVSEELAAYARAGGVTDVSVIPLGVDTDVFRPPASPASGVAKSGGRTAIYVGDVTIEKGAPCFTDAVAALPEPWRGVVVGEGPLRAELEARAGGRVRFLGRIPHAEVARALAGADVLCLPSRSEGAPMAVLEALACGVPVAATRVGGIPEIVEEGVTGALVAPDAGPDVLAAAILRAAALGRVAPPRGISAAERASEVERVLEAALRPGSGQACAAR